MYRCKTLLSAGLILILRGAAIPAAVQAEAPAGMKTRSQTTAQVDRPSTRAQVDQSARLHQPITLEFVDAPLGSVLEAIARSVGLTLAYNPDILPMGKTVTLRAFGLPARHAIARVLTGTKIEPSMTRSGHLTLARRSDPPDAAADIAATIPQQAELNGIVTDVGSGEALIGAQVRVDESEFSAVTDANGRYTLEDVPTGTHTLVASMIGYAEERRTVTLTARTTASVDFALTVSALPLDEMVVTGTMVPTQMRAVPSPVSVITAADIALMGAARLEEILRSVPGLGVVSYDNEPRLSYLNVRGTTGLTEGQNTIKTYIDGVEVAQSVYSLNQIDPASIERIELIRGPQASTLHGSGAIAGVLQIFTKKGHLGRQTPRIQATILGGHLESDYARGFTPIQRHNVAITGGAANVSLNLGASYRYAGEWVEDQLIDELGWSINNSANEDLNLSAGLRYGSGPVTAEATARVHNNVAGLPSSRALTDRARDGRWNYPSATKPSGIQTELQAHTYGVTLDYEPTSWWRHHFAVGYDRTLIDYRRSQPRKTTPADTFLYYQSQDWARRSIAYGSAIYTRLGPNVSTTLQVGFDRSSLRRQNVIVDDARQLTGGLGNQNADVALGGIVNHGFFMQMQAAWQDQLFLTAGVRADRSSGFGDDRGYVWSPRVGLSHVIEVSGVSLKARASYGSAIRPPEPDQKFGRTDPSTILLANEKLAPETQSGFDAGLELYLGERTSLALTRYFQRADDLIALVYLSDFVTVPRTTQYQNVGRIENTGWEFEGKANLAGFTVRANYSVLNSIVEALSPTYTGSDHVVGRRPLWVPRSTANASVTRSGDRGAITIAVTYKGPWEEYRYIPYLNALVGTDPGREPYTGSPRDYIATYPAVRRWSVNGTLRITKRVTGLLIVDNLLNDGGTNRRDLDLVKGRQIMIGLRLDTGT